MQKWRLESRIGSSRASCHTNRSCVSRSTAYRRFQTCPLRLSSSGGSDDASPEATGATKPTPSRTQRNQEANRDILNLFKRSVAKENSRSADGRIPPPPAPSAHGERPTPALDGSKRINVQHAGREKFSSRTDRQTSPGAIDARSLGAARPPDSAPRFTLRRVDSAGLSADKTGGNDRRPPRAQGTRPPPTKSGRAKSAERKPMRAKKQAGGKSSRVDQYKYEEMMEEYAKEREVTLAPKPVAYEPPALQLTDLYDRGSRTIVGDLSMHGTLSQKIELAAWYESGKPRIDRRQSWEGTRQKQNSLAVIEGLQHATGETASSSATVGKGSTDKPPEAPMDVINTLFSGSYISARPQLRGRNPDVLSHVARQAARNGSYERGDEQSLMARVSSIVSTAPTTPSKGAPRRAATRT